MASTGVSRRTVASQVGKPESTIRGWIERGLAYPEEEPYGSFAVDYCRAERGLAAAIGSTMALRVQIAGEQLAEYDQWRRRGPAPLKPQPPAKLGRKASDLEKADYKEALGEYERAHQRWEAETAIWETPPPHPDVQEMVWLERLRIARWPNDYGTSKHRQPEPDLLAGNYLDSHSMEREQLGALFADPPEPIRLALVDSADKVYAVLLAGGFDPAQRKATNETE